MTVEERVVWQEDLYVSLLKEIGAARDVIEAALKTRTDENIVPVPPTAATGDPTLPTTGADGTWP